MFLRGAEKIAAVCSQQAKQSHNESCHNESEATRQSQ